MKRVLIAFFSIAVYQLTAMDCCAQDKADKKTEITIEEVTERCKGIPSSEKITVKVARFSVSAKNAYSQFGDEMATMLTSAIQQTSCFKVLETNRNMSDMTGEITTGQEGFTDGSGPAAGQLMGAQLIATGEVTEFAKGSKGGSYLGVVSLGKDKATVGFIIKLLNPQTGEILFSKSINAKGESKAKTSVVFGGIKSQNDEGDRAVSNAMEKGIIQAVQLLIDAKNTIEIPKPVKLEGPKKFTAANCSMLQNGGGPKIMIIIPEAQFQGATTKRENIDNRSQAELDAEERRADRQLTRDVFTSIFGNKQNNNNAPSDNNGQSKNGAAAIFKPVVVEQATAENEIVKQFIESGFRVIDPKIAIKLRQKMDSLGGNDDIAVLAAAGQKLGANIIITGVAISEPVGNKSGMVSYRGTIELRAVATEDATILASNTVNAGGVDVADAVAAKISLKNASSKMAAYMLEQLCTRNFSFKDAGGNVQKSSMPASSGNSTSITLSNISYSQLQGLETYLKSNTKIKEVKKTFSSNTARLTVVHTLSTSQVADILSAFKTYTIDIQNLDENSIDAKVK